MRESITSKDAAAALERIAGSRRIISDDGRVLFTTPAEALKEKVRGNPLPFIWVAIMMRIAAGEMDAVQAEQIIEAECRKVECGNVGTEMDKARSRYL